MTEKKDKRVENSHSDEIVHENIDSKPDVGENAFRNPNRDKKEFPIVAIGASAGGLKAFEFFFSEIPPDSGMAFILVSHLDPSHGSILNELIKRYTKMEVAEAEDKMHVEKNKIFIIPPNKIMTYSNQQLFLTEFSDKRGVRHPIDHFFKSIAMEMKENSICIIFSGTGTDGTLGLREVKGVGGIAIVQDPDSAKYDGMPRSAINNVAVDLILPPKEIAKKLIEYSKNNFKTVQKGIQEPGLKIASYLSNIFNLLQKFSGYDFSIYKQNTLLRRIEKRMLVCQINQVEDYILHLKKNPAEIKILFHELLIGVTNFFRDREAFDILEEEVIHFLIKDHPMYKPLRIWVPACSTGEEAYSIAMIIHDKMKSLNKEVKFQIFATDIDELAIEKARTGLFPENIASDIPPERLRRFFTKINNFYQIKKRIRDNIIFAVQNLVSDPPFLKLDLISCRNVLIYLVTDIQKKMVSLFHYSLNLNGYLFLGSSESLWGYQEYFRVINQRWKFFQKKKIPISLRNNARIFPPIMDSSLKRKDIVYIKEKISYQSLVEKKILQDYAPASVLINKKNEIIYIFGRTSKFLELPIGEIKIDIIEMAREELKLELATAIRKSTETNKNVIYERIKVKINGNYIWVKIHVSPIQDPPEMNDLLLISFQETPESENKEDGKNIKLVIDETGQQRINQLEVEIKNTKQFLQATIEELETSNEELKSTNEELQSSNEELQSTNEELQTSKEELQSINEELIILNTELEEKIAELFRINNDLKNLMENTNVPTIFLDNDLIIKNFTPDAFKIFNLIPTDVGRPLEHISSNLVGINLLDEIKVVQETLERKEIEVQTKDQHWYVTKIAPYVTLDKKIEGTVISFENVTTQKELSDDSEFYKDILVHEISNIFQIIINASNLIKDDFIDTTVLGKASTNPVRIINRQVEKAKNLIQNVIRLAELSQEKNELERVNFHGYLNKVINDVKTTNFGKDLSIQIETNQDPEEMYINGNEFLQDLFENLLLNAINHNENEKIEVIIKISQIVKENKDYFKLEFIDNGIGVPDRLKTEIFKRLFHKRKKGIGMGLSIVKKIIKNFNGEIWVENKILDDHAKGSNFIIIFPVALEI